MAQLSRLTRRELRELRAIVRRVYHQELYRENPAAHAELMSDRECDKIIESILPETVEALREKGVKSGFVERKKFFGKSKILDALGQPILR